jgi:hypothetical protein
MYICGGGIYGGGVFDAGLSGLFPVINLFKPSPTEPSSSPPAIEAKTRPSNVYTTPSLLAICALIFASESTPTIDVRIAPGIPNIRVCPMHIRCQAHQFSHPIPHILSSHGIHPQRQMNFRKHLHIQKANQTTAMIYIHEDEVSNNFDE